MGSYSRRESTPGRPQSTRYNLGGGGGYISRLYTGFSLLECYRKNQCVGLPHGPGLVGSS